MRTENGKIVGATKAELLSLYLDRGYDDCMYFYEYINLMKRSGCVIVKEG